MISLADLRYLEAAEAWLKRGGYCNCFEELRAFLIVTMFACRGFGGSFTVPRCTPQRPMALDIQRRYPEELDGHIWRLLSLQNGLAPFLVALGFAW
jgi:hypothetical protein